MVVTDEQKNGKLKGKDEDKIGRDSLIKSVEIKEMGNKIQNELTNFSSELNLRQIPSLPDSGTPYPPVQLVFMEEKESENKNVSKCCNVDRRSSVLPSDNSFPWLTDLESLEYKTYSRMCFDVMSIGPLICLITIFYCCHANFQYALEDGPFFIIGLVFGVVASYMYYMFFLLGHTARRYHSPCDSSRSFLRSFETFIFNSSYLEDFIAVTATISASSYLYARVLNGQCAADTTLWVSNQ